MTDLRRPTATDVLSWGPCWSRREVIRWERENSRYGIRRALLALHENSPYHARWLICQWWSRWHPGRMLWWAAALAEHEISDDRNPDNWLGRNTMDAARCARRAVLGLPVAESGSAHWQDQLRRNLANADRTDTGTTARLVYSYIPSVRARWVGMRPAWKLYLGPLPADALEQSRRRLAQPLEIT